jgi:hypothetical protein
MIGVAVACSKLRQSPDALPHMQIDSIGTARLGHVLVV